VLADGEAPGLVSETLAASVPPAAEPRTVTETEWFSLSGWRWVVPGAVLGLLVGVAAARVRRTRADEPRQVLVDA
jgi:anti-sigma-K factor RskA